MVTFKNYEPKKDPNVGIHTYEGSEVANLALGQNGFDILHTNADYVEEDATVTGSCLGNWTKGWVAIKIIGGNACTVEAVSNVGDDLTDGTAVDGSSGVPLSDTDVVYGNFKKVLLQTKGTNSIVICYRG